MLFVFASLIENGAGTGWTLNGRELLWGDPEAIKLFSMIREHLQVLNSSVETHVIGYSCLSKITYVKMPIARRQYAWLDKENYSSHQRLNEEYLKNNEDWFEQWLVGMTDGDGSFTIARQNDKWSLVFKITQSRYNLRLLYYIKRQLGVSTVTKDKTKGQILIRDRKKIAKFIIPIFDKYPLLTSKQFNYEKFKKAFFNCFLLFCFVTFIWSHLFYHIYFILSIVILSSLYYYFYTVLIVLYFIYFNYFHTLLLWY